MKKYVFVSYHAFNKELEGVWFGYQSDFCVLWCSIFEEVLHYFLWYVKSFGFHTIYL